LQKIVFWRRARDLDEAVSITKENPEIESSTTARIEVRPLGMKEESTSLVYPPQGGRAKEEGGRFKR
jgi:hypothetical protein